MLHNGLNHILEKGLMILLQNCLITMLHNGLNHILEKGLMILLQNCLITMLHNGLNHILEKGLMILLQNCLITLLQNCLITVFQNWIITFLHEGLNGMLFRRPLRRTLEDGRHHNPSKNREPLIQWHGVPFHQTRENQDKFKHWITHDSVGTVRRRQVFIPWIYEAFVSGMMLYKLHMPHNNACITVCPNTVPVSLYAPIQCLYHYMPQYSACITTCPKTVPVSLYAPQQYDVPPFSSHFPDLT